MRVYYSGTEVTGVTHVDFDLKVDGINGGTIAIADPNRASVSTWKARIHAYNVVVHFDDGTLAFSGTVVNVHSLPASIVLTVAGDLYALTQGEITANYAAVKTTVADMYNSGGTNWVVSAETVAGDAYIGYYMQFSDLTDTPTSASAWYDINAKVKAKYVLNNVEDNNLSEYLSFASCAVADDSCHVIYGTTTLPLLPYQDHVKGFVEYEFDFSDKDQPVGLLEVYARLRAGAPVGGAADCPANWLDGYGPMNDAEMFVYNYQTGGWEGLGKCPVGDYNVISFTVPATMRTHVVDAANKKAKVRVYLSGWYLAECRLYVAIDFLQVKLLYTDAAMFLNCPPIKIADNTMDEFTGEGNPDLSAAPYNVETGDGFEITTPAYYVISGVKTAESCPSIARYLPAGMLTDIDDDGTAFGRSVIGAQPASVLNTIARAANYHWFERLLGTGEKCFVYCSVANFYDNSATIADADVDPAGGTKLSWDYGPEKYCKVIYLGQEKRFGIVSSRVQAVAAASGTGSARVLTLTDSSCGSTSEAQLNAASYLAFLDDDDLSLEIPLADSAATRAVMPGEVVTISIYENSATKTIDLSSVPVWWKHCSQDAGGPLQQVIRVGRGEIT